MVVQSEQKKTINQSNTRMFFLDNIRIFLTLLVIFHHAAIAYGGVGDWGVSDPAVDDISPIFLTLFNAINQSFFMSAFFLFAGYFTPRSLEKKGTKSFLVDRLIRLGIPILVYTTLIINLNEYILSVVGKGQEFQLQLTYAPGHLWFLQALLLFAVIYIIFRAIAGQQEQESSVYFQDSFPTDKFLFVSISILAVLTFVVRLAFPVGLWTLSLQLGHFIHYIFSFFIGILAYRGDWLRHLSSKQAKHWGWIALVVILSFFPLFILGGALEGDANIAKFLGGIYWQAFAYALWETLLLIAINVFLLSFFRNRFNQSSTISKWMAVNIFTVYIVHQTVLFFIQIQLLPVNIPTIVKFFISGLIAVPISFLLSILLRQIPYARRVLG